MLKFQKSPQFPITWKGIFFKITFIFLISPNLSKYSYEWLSLEQDHKIGIYIYIYIQFYIKGLKINCFQIFTWDLCFLILPTIINCCLQRAFSTPLLLFVVILSFLINIHTFMFFLLTKLRSFQTQNILSIC